MSPPAANLDALKGQRETLTLDADQMLMLIQLAVFAQACSHGVVNNEQLADVIRLQGMLSEERYNAVWRATAAIVKRHAEVLGVPAIKDPRLSGAVNAPPSPPNTKAP
jgi:hypothetical protein